MRREATTGPLRELLIAEWERRRERWPLAEGQRDEKLEDLRAHVPVVVHADTLLSVFMRARLPHAQFCYGGSDYEKVFVLDEHDRLYEWEPE
jgi:hypothetical protein